MSRLTVIAQATSFLLFPLLFIVLATPEYFRIHPNLGELPDQQIQQVAASAIRWRLVHLGLAVACLMGVVTILSLRSLVSGRLPSLIANAATTVGVAGAVVLIAILWQEVTIIPSLAKACAAAADACLSSSNEAFFQRFADLGWRHIFFLHEGGRGLALGLLALGLLGWKTRALRFWEALPLALGSASIVIWTPSLHGEAAFALVGVLLGIGSYAVRAVRREWMLHP